MGPQALWFLDLKVINIYHIISFKSKSLEIDKVSQNRLDAIKNHAI